MVAFDEVQVGDGIALVCDVLRGAGDDAAEPSEWMTVAWAGHPLVGQTAAAEARPEVRFGALQDDTLEHWDEANPIPGTQHAVPGDRVALLFVVTHLHVETQTIEAVRQAAPKLGRTAGPPVYGTVRVGCRADEVHRHYPQTEVMPVPAAFPVPLDWMD